MSLYKQLNKELVEKVQEMKIQLNLYCNEIVSLKRDMMHKHEEQTFLRKKCFYLAVESFKKIIQTVEPESSIIEKIREFEPQSEDLSIVNGNCYQQNRRSVNSSSSSNEHRRSEQLREELLRSNNVIHSRQSLCSTSPTRRSSGSRNVQSEIVSDILQPDSPTKEVESSQQLNIDHIIFEESDDEIVDLPKTVTAAQALQHNTETICNESEATAEEETNNKESSQYENDEEITINTFHTKTTKAEVSYNDSAEDISKKISPPQQKAKKKRKHKRTASRRTLTRKQHRTSNDESHEFTDSSPAFKCDRQHSSKISNKETKNENENIRLTDIIAKSMDVDESLQEQREFLDDKTNGARRKSIRIPQIIATEASLTTSFAVNDSTLKNFNQAVASSTPHSIRKVAKQATSDSPPILPSNNSRPSRKCKPKNLTEQKLGTKLRNDSETENKTMRYKSKKKN